MKDDINNVLSEIDQIYQEEITVFTGDEIKLLLLEDMKKHLKSFEVKRKVFHNAYKISMISGLEITEYLKKKAACIKNIKMLKTEIQKRNEQSMVKKPKTLIDTETFTRGKLENFVKEIISIDQAGTILESIPGVEVAKMHMDILNNKYTSQVLDAVLLYIKQGKYEITYQSDKETVDAILIEDDWDNFCQENNLITDTDKKEVKSIVYDNKLSFIDLYYPENGKTFKLRTNFINIEKGKSAKYPQLANLPNAEMDDRLISLKFRVNFEIFKSLLRETYLKQHGINPGRGYMNMPALLTSHIDRAVNFLNTSSLNNELFIDKRRKPKKFRYDNNYKLAIQYILKKYTTGKEKRIGDFHVSLKELIENGGLEFGKRIKTKKQERIGILIDIAKMLLVHLKDTQNQYLREYQRIYIDEKKEHINFIKFQKELNFDD